MKTKRRKNKNKSNDVNNVKSGLKLELISPLNDNQQLAFDAWNRGDNIVLKGFPGTGKTFLALYFALKEIFIEGTVSDLTLVRSTVPSRDLGFLKGGVDEKIAVYESPYYSICTELFGRSDSYDILKQKEIIKFVPTSFERGTTKNSLLVLDECQNMNFMELHTLITRLGEFGRIILCGDLEQDDLTSERYNTKTGFGDISNILNNVPNTTIIDFEMDDIVRSEYIRNYLIAKADYEKRNIL